MRFVAVAGVRALTVVVHEYEDTRIRYHFADFRAIVPSRQMCFEQPPHACGDAAATTRRVQCPRVIPHHSAIKHGFARGMGALDALGEVDAPHEL
jgi:hypothetical protein